MKENFEKAIAFTLSWEGTYSDNLNDPGGETKWGISKRAYPNTDIENLTKEQAIEIYRKDYWTCMNCDNLPYPLDIVMFDTGVNMGTGRADIFLRQTMDWRDFLILRITKYSDLAKKNPTFLRGWINRVIALWQKVK